MRLDVEYHPGATALAVLQRLRSESAATGRSAFLIGDARDVTRLEAHADPDPAVIEGILRSSRAFDAAGWFERRLREMEVDGEHAGELLGAWPGSLPKMGPTLHLEMGRAPKARVAIARVGVPESWQIPAALGFGGWNECPGVVEQCATAKRWAERYDADIIGVSGDTIEWEVRKPPRTRDEAIALAWEQYAFCADIVDQGVDTVGNLGGTLLDSPNWYFWWD
jgi:hypothetical protein